MKKLFKHLWVGYQKFLFAVFGNKTRSWIIDPSFLFNRNYNRDLMDALEYAGGILLDLGCGNKDYKGLFMPKLAAYYGMDHPLARDVHLRDVDTNGPEIWGDIYSLPFKSACADTILSLQVFEHLNDPARAMKEVSRVAKKGGCLIITTHGLFPIHGPPYDYYRYTEFGLRYLMEKNGCQVIKITPNGSFWQTMAVLFNHYLFYQFFEIRSWYISKAFFALLKIILTPMLILIVVLVNSICLILDRLHRDFTVTTNYTVVARKL